MYEIHIPTIKCIDKMMTHDSIYIFVQSNAKEFFKINSERWVQHVVPIILVMDNQTHPESIQAHSYS